MAKHKRHCAPPCWLDREIALASRARDLDQAQRNDRASLGDDVAVASPLNRLIADLEVMLRLWHANRGISA